MCETWSVHQKIDTFGTNLLNLYRWKIIINFIQRRQIILLVTIKSREFFFLSIKWLITIYHFDYLFTVEWTLLLLHANYEMCNHQNGANDLFIRSLTSYYFSDSNFENEEATLADVFFSMDMWWNQTLCMASIQKNQRYWNSFMRKM